MDIEEEFELLFNDRSLKARLATVGRQVGFREVAVGIYKDGRFVFASTDNKDDSVERRFTENSRVRVGCAAKPLTASLVFNAIAEGRMALETDLGEALLQPQLRGVKLRHLLNHTHGLDAAPVSKIATTQAGFIDVALLCANIAAAPRLASPGQFFSYSSLGAWLAAALLERIYACPYSDVLWQRILSRLPSFVDESQCVNPFSAGDICPATGGNLSLSTRDMVSFVLEHLPFDKSFSTGQQDERFALMRAERFRPDVWQSKFRGIGLGWFEFAGEWFGHGAMMNGDSALTRFHPGRGIAIAISAKHEEGSFATLGALFSKVLPEFLELQTPDYILHELWLGQDPSPYLGVYQNSSLKVVIEVAANRLLKASVYHSDGARASPVLKRFLRPAEGNLFIATQRESRYIPFVHFLCPDSDGDFTYAHTGQQLLRKVPAPISMK